MRALIAIALGLVFAGDNAPAGVTNSTASDSKVTSETPSLTEQSEENTWSFSLSASTYVVPDDRDYVQPSFTADRDWLHLEARYNYENHETGSIWIGYNFSGGKKVEWELTPMLGGVLGNTVGIAPGYRGSLSWWKLTLSSEGEFVFDTRSSEGSFFYNWSELSISPVEWFRFGLVGQRTRAYQSDVDIQRGVLAGFSCRKVDVTAYVFNLDRGKPTYVFSVGLEF